MLDLSLNDGIKVFCADGREGKEMDRADILACIFGWRCCCDETLIDDLASVGGEGRLKMGQYRELR